MRVLTKREMRSLNEWLPGAASALNFWKSEAARVGLLKTMHALDKATQELGREVADAKERFESSGRRPHNRR